MFTSIGKLFNFINVIINALSILVLAGEKRAQHLSTINDFDIEKAEEKLKTDMREWKAEQEQEREKIIDPKEFKPAA